MSLLTKSEEIRVKNLSFTFHLKDMALVTLTPITQHLSPVLNAKIQQLFGFSVFLSIFS